MIASATPGLTIAVGKGRILDEAVPLLARVGIVPREDPARSRKLIIDADVDPAGALKAGGGEEGPVRLVILRSQDVPTYLEYGAADAGIAGRDVLLEYPGGGEWYEPLDLGIARCRLMVAARAGDADEPWPASRAMRVASKYERITAQHFAAQGIQTEIVKLYGSMELAPLVGLADRIVDLVDTGATLKANGLAPVENIADVSARLIVNKASMKMKAAAVKGLVAALRAEVGADA